MYGGQVFWLATVSIILIASTIYTLISISISINIQPLGQFGQEPEPSQAIGMALVCCILGKFLEVVCHCFPPRLDVPTFIARRLDVCNDARHPRKARKAVR